MVYDPSALLIEGRFRRRSRWRSRAWRFAATARNRQSRKARDPARQALRPGREEHRCTDPEEMPGMEARPPAQNRHGGAPRGARLPLETQGTPLGAWPAASCAGPTGAAAPERLSAHRPPLVRVDNGCKTPGANAPRERDVLFDGLFDIVR